MNQWMNLREERDFGEKFNATFLFARQNFKNLGIILLLLGTPLLIAGNLFLAYFQVGVQTEVANFGKLSSGIWGFYILSIFVYLIAYTWLMTVTLVYMTEYAEGNREITLARVFSRASGKLGKLIGANLLITFIIAIASILLLIPGIYLSVAFALIPAIIVIEDDPVFEAISRSISLVKTKWWSTFGLIIVMSVVAGMMQMVFTIPNIIYSVTKALHAQLATFDTLSVIFQVLASIGTALLYPLVFIAIAFQYFNLVERKESEGLKQQIMMAGKQVETTAKNEGEY